MDDGLNALWIKLFLFSKTSKPWSTLPSDYSSFTTVSQPTQLKNSFHTHNGGIGHGANAMTHTSIMLSPSRVIMGRD
jgi:hypothetical protein